MSMYRTLCNQGLCMEEPEHPYGYCAAHSTPGWESYRKWKIFLIKLSVILVTLPLLVAAVTIAWRFAILVIVQ